MALTLGSAPGGIAAGDLDNDLDLDLVVSNQGRSSVTVLLNELGAFTPAGEFSVIRAPRLVALGDLDGDGDLDIAAAKSLLGGTNAELTLLYNRTIP